MTIDAVSEMTNNALYVIIKVSLPVFLVSLIGSGHQYFSDSDIHSGTDTDLCTEDHCHLLCLVIYLSLDDEYYGRIHGAALVKFQPVCT